MKRHPIPRILRLAALLVASAPGVGMAQSKVTFLDHVLPVVETHCSKCHNPDKPKADLDLSTFSATMKGGSSGLIVAGGDPDGSSLYKVVAQTAEPFMPPKSKLSDKEIDLVKKWIADVHPARFCLYFVVAKAIADKMIRRHPHVFGDASERDVATQTVSWEATKAAERAENLAKKITLCERAEALSSSNNWVQTAEALKTLQADWKEIGPVTRGQEKSVWERFRKACDEFFTRRQEDLKQRKQDWTENLKRKEALVAEARQLSESTEWEQAAARIKKLQADWKTIGPLRRAKSEQLWTRFRTAADTFFERYHHRHELALAGKVRYRIDPDNPYPRNFTGHIKVTLNDGSTVVERQRSAPVASSRAYMVPLVLGT